MLPAAVAHESTALAAFGTFGLILYVYPYLGLAFIPLTFFFVRGAATNPFASIRGVLMAVPLRVILPSDLSRDQTNRLDLSIVHLLIFRGAGG